MDIVPLFQVRSIVPGRIRWDVSTLLDNPGLCKGVEEAFRELDGVQSIAANPVTGRVLLIFAPALPARPFEAFLQSVLERPFVIRPHSPESNFGPSQLEAARGRLATLVSLLKGHKAQAVATFGIAFLDRLFEAVPPALIGLTLDVVTRRSRSFLGRLGFLTLRSQLATLAGILGAIWTIDAVMGYLHRVTSARLALTVQEDLRKQLYAKLQALDIGQLESRQISAWTSLFDSDISRIGQFIESGIDPIVTVITNGVIVTVTFATHSASLFATQLVIVPGLYFISKRLLDPIRQQHEKSGEAYGRLSTAIRSNVSGMSTIAVFKTQELEAARIAKLSSEYREASQKRAEVTAAYIFAIQMAVGTGFITTLIWGATLVNREKLSIASFNVMGFTSLKLLTALGNLGHSLAEFQRTTVAIEHVQDFLRRTSKAVEGNQLLPPTRSVSVAFENVKFEYEPGRLVFENVSLTIAPSKITGIVGPTGAGKTTLLKLLLRFYDPQGGNILVNGINIQEFQLNDLRGLMSLVSQNTFLFTGSVRDNIAYSRPSASAEDVIRAARAAQAHEFVQSLPKGYDTTVGESGMQLSGGERQRIAIARALLANRPVLLFDEATSSIDYETEAAIGRGIRRLTGKRTTVIVAHRLSTVRNADWIYVLHRGRVHEEGTHEELIEHQGIYADLWRVQIGESNVLPPSPETIGGPQARRMSTETERNE